MTNDKMKLADTLIHLLALAVRLEGEGQYNLAKLARAAADSLSRQAAYQVTIPSTREALTADIKRMAEALASLDVGGDLLSALMQGAEVMAEGGLPLFSLIPHPYVCRSCGHLILAEPGGNVPHMRRLVGHLSTLHAQLLVRRAGAAGRHAAPAPDAGRSGKTPGRIV